MFKKILVANRGEIARRIMTTCHEMGIAVVAVYSDVDRNAVHVLEADHDVYLGGAGPRDSYLNIDRIIEVAKECSADLLVMGAYGHTKVRELVVGSTTAYAMNHAPCPLLLTR